MWRRHLPQTYTKRFDSNAGGLFVGGEVQCINALVEGEIPLFIDRSTLADIVRRLHKRGLLQRRRTSRMRVPTP